MQIDSQTKRIQAIELEILKQCLEIIERHNLRYFILGGTLLGAVRHKGFIPWDDDIDIGMPRPDYERFLQYAAAEVHEPFALHTHDSGVSKYRFYYCRVVNVKYWLLRSDKGIAMPAWVDVFPLDGAPGDPEEAAKWFREGRKLLFKYARSQVKDYYPEIPREFRTNIRKELYYRLGLSHFLSEEHVWRSCDRVLRRYPYDEATHIINFCGYWQMRECFPKEYYGEGADYPFGDLILRGPANYDAVLTQMYGDYMTPPPENKRNHHRIGELIEKP